MKRDMDLIREILLDIEGEERGYFVYLFYSHKAP
ncbi:MAG: DUF2513 domain-containing protein [Fibrobacter sp.]|nr:DUF2513 domain-containing protein [Fibrobacter sp.]